jgi:hypothetical protein
LCEASEVFTRKSGQGIVMTKFVIAGMMAALMIIAGVMGYFSHRIFPGLAQDVYRIVSVVGFICTGSCVIYAIRFNLKRGK